MNTELLFQINRLVNQACIYAIVTNWCYKFALKKEKRENIPTPVDNRSMTNVEHEEVEMLISSPNQTQGNLMMQSEAQNLECRKQGSHNPIMRKSLIPISRNRWKIPPRSTRWRRRMARSYTSMRKIYLFSSLPANQTKPLGPVPAGTILGPVQEVHIVKLLDEYGIEVTIPSICKLGDWTCVVISRETERFVNEIHTHEARIRSSGEVLENSQDCKESVSYKQREVTTSPRETWVAPSTRETRVGSAKLVPNKASIYTRKTTPRNEKKWITIHANPKRGGDLALQNHHIHIASLQSRRTRVWWIETLVLIAEKVWTGWSPKFLWGSVVTKDLWRPLKDKNGVLWKLRWNFVLFTSVSRVFWRYSKRAWTDGSRKNSAKLEEILVPPRTSVEFSVLAGKRTNSRRKGERQSPSSSLSNTNKYFW